VLKEHELLEIIHKTETPTLEFKSTFYTLQDVLGNENKRQKDEMLRDILALANGSIETVGQPAYLIFGVSDQISDDGHRKIVGVEPNLPCADDLLKMLRAVSAPPIAHLETEWFLIDSKHIYVICVPFSPYLHETIRDFQTDKQKYTRYVVFSRQNSEIIVANASERKALEDLKAFRFRDRKHVPNVLAGGLIGAVLLGSLIGSNPERIFQKPVSKQLAWVTGGLIGALFGSLMGYNLESFHEMFRIICYKFLKRIG